jgi:hypothetical protein
VLVHTVQRQPSCGTPVDVPVPKIVIFMSLHFYEELHDKMKNEECRMKNVFYSAH